MCDYEQEPEVPEDTPDIAAITEKWAKILRLQDWDIDVRWAHAHEMMVVEGVGAGQVAGMVGRDPEHRSARIKVLYLDELAPDMAPVMYDVEATIVHELLHIVLPDSQDETAINQITQALLRVRG